MKVTSTIFNQVKTSLQNNFEENEFKAWTEKENDKIFIRVRDNPNNMKFFVAKSMYETLMPDVIFDIQLIPYHSDFWKKQGEAS